MWSKLTFDPWPEILCLLRVQDCSSVFKVTPHAETVTPPVNRSNARPFQVCTHAKFSVGQWVDSQAPSERANDSLSSFLFLTGPVLKSWVERTCVGLRFVCARGCWWLMTTAVVVAAPDFQSCWKVRGRSSSWLLNAAQTLHSTWVWCVWVCVALHFTQTILLLCVSHLDSYAVKLARVCCAWGEGEQEKSPSFFACRTIQNHSTSSIPLLCFILICSLMKIII